jgi:mycofactocin system glycosyltransferase
MSAVIAERVAVTRGTSASGQEARYSLQPGLELVSTESGGLLLCLRPLIVMRLNPRAFALLSKLRYESTANQLAEDSSSADVSFFLDDLVRRRFLLRRPPVPQRWPIVSLIVPAHGRPAATRACIESLLALDYPAECREIIVVDDASEPPLPLTDLPIRLLRQDRNIGQSAARNLAAREARGELLAFIDNDCIAQPDWLRTLVPYLSEPAVGIAGGRVIAPLSDGAIAAFEAVRSPLDMGPIGGEVGPAEAIAYLPTCNLIVRRDLLLAQAGFDGAMRLGEDVDFIWRALANGVRARYVPEGRIVHYHRVRLQSLLSRRADYGSSEAELQRRHPRGWRVMPWPVTAVLLVAVPTAATLSWTVGFALGALGLLLVVFEVAAKHRRLRRAGATVPLPRIGEAVLREHGASFYHLSANVTRYYSLPLLVAGLFWPALLLTLAPLVLIAPISDHRRQRPRLSLPAFVGLYGLEMAAYQLGVWRGCLQRGTLRPLLPKLKLRR